jgi:septal ring factor EnvC (AmiA/AmiB activator)
MTAMTSRHDAQDHDEALLIDIPSERSETSTAIVTASHGGSAGEWPVAIRMVERAAGLIKDYEQKLRSLEENTRAYMLRVTAEQERSRERTLELEGQLEHLESVLTHTTDELRETRLEATQTNLKLRSTEVRLAEAEAEISRGAAYAMQVEMLLGDI